MKGLLPAHFPLLKLMEILKVERIDHLGVVAGVIKDLKLIEILDERLGLDPCEEITTGEAVAAMILWRTWVCQSPAHTYARVLS